MDLHLQSLAFALSVALILLYAMLALVVTRVGDEPAYRALKHGAICAAFGVGLNATQGMLHPFIPFVIGNALVVMGMAWVWVGTRRLCGEQPRAAVVHVTGALVALGGWYWGLVAPSLSGRLTLVSAAIFCFSLPTAWTLLLDRRLASIGLIVRWLGALEFCTAALIAVRLLMHWVYAIPHLDILEQHPANVVVYFTLLLSHAAFAMGLNLLVVSRLVDKLYGLATRDALTGALNRTGLVRSLQEASGRGFSGLLLMDLDHFKRINDEHGHDAGDGLLRRFTELVQAQVGPGDVLVRMGGEEFLLLVAAADPHSLAERIRHAYAGQEAILRASVSIGVVHLGPDRLLDLRRDLKAADDALYAAKRGGRDRVQVAKPA